MESDKRPHYPCDFCEDELSLIENLVLGNVSGNVSRSNNNRRNNNCDRDNDRDNDNCRRNRRCDHDNDRDNDDRNRNNDTLSGESRTCMCNCNDDDRMNCSNCEMPDFDDNTALAMVYSPDHEFKNMYEPECGLEAGTLFKRLHKPFMGATVSGGCRR